MNSNSKSKLGNENQEKNLETLRTILECKDRYHDHKETMAHAAILIQLGILTILLRMDCWPLLEGCYKVVVLIGYVLMWAIISGYMLWQLDNRRLAAEQVDKLIKVLKDKTDKELRNVIEDMIGIRGGPRIGEVILWTADVLILIIALLRMILPW